MSTHTDRELLELASKAAGLSNHVYVDDISGMCEPKVHGVPHCGYNFASAFNPLDSDGDALRLAIKIGLSIIIADGDMLVARAHAHAQGLEGVEVCGNIDSEPCADVRRAIVRAAAEIGMADTN